MTAIPEDWAEQVLAGQLSGPPPNDPLDWLGPEVDGLADDLALTFDQSEKLAAALAAVFESMSDDELSRRYRSIEAGLRGWGISCFYVDGGGLIFEWADRPLLVCDVELPYGAT
jgi:hypothetical protein